MLKVQESLLRVLSDAMWRKTSEHSYSESEWEEILTLAEDQGVLFLLLQGCSSLRAQVSSANWQKWRSKLLSTIMNNDSLMAVQDKIVGLMSDKGIPCAILKGASLASCYYDPSVRALGDIDLLVAPQYVDQAVDILLKLGFYAPEESFAHPYHIDFYRNQIVAELHFAVSGFPDSAAGAEAKSHMDLCWQQLRWKHYNGHSFPCLSDFHQALSLMIHMERHMTTGCIGLRQLCDWAVFVRSVSPDYFAGQILPALESCGLAEFARALTKTAVQYLGLDPDHVPWCGAVKSKLTEAMMAEVLRAGSIHNRNNTDDTSSLFVESTGSKSAIRVFIRKINNIAGRKFPITKKIPALLPVFWVFIPLRYWVRSLLGMRKRKSVLRTIAMTKQRKLLYRELRLFQNDD